MADLISIGFKYTGGLGPMANDAKIATGEVNRLDAAQESLKRTEEQATKVAGRLAMSLRDKNNLLKATASGSKEAIQKAKLENLENKLLAQGINKELIPALLKLQKENLQLEESTKAAAQAQRGMRKASQASTKELRKNSVRLGQAGIQFEQLANQLQGGGNALLAFSQQSADLGIVLGFPLLGAVAGLTGAFVSLLGPAVIDLTDKSKVLQKAMDELEESFSRADSGSINLSNSIRTLANQSEELGRLALVEGLQDARQVLRDTDKAVEDFVESLDILETFSFLGFEFGTSNIDTITKQLDNLGLTAEIAFQKIQEGGQNSNRNLSRLITSAREVSKELGITQQQSISLGSVLGALEDGATADELNNLKEELTAISQTTSINSKNFQKLVEDVLPMIKAFEDGRDSAKLIREELAGINTSLRFDETDSLSEIQEKLAGIRKEVKSSEDFEKYKDIYTELTTNLDKLSNESYVEFFNKIEQETSLIGASVAEQEIYNFVKSTGILLTEEQISKLTDLIEKREAEKNAINEVSDAEKAAQERLKEFRKEQEALNNAIANTFSSLSLQRRELNANAEGTSEARVNLELFKFEQELTKLGMDDSTEALKLQKEEILRLKRENLELAESYKQVQKDSKAAGKEQKELNSLLSDIEKGADRIGTAFQTSGNGIIDTFGEAITVLNDFSKQNSLLIKDQEALDAKRIEYAGNAKELLKIEQSPRTVKCTKCSKSIIGYRVNSWCV